MSSGSATRTIKFVSKAGTYTATILCPDGDLYQEWVGSESEVSKIYPNFANTTPLLNFVCTSSRSAEGIVTPDAVLYYFNGQKIEFNGDTSSGTFAGLFKKISPSANQLYYGLKIVKNIVEASGFAPATIKMVGTVSYGTQVDQIQATYTIPIQKSTGTSYRVTIKAGDNNNFVIRDKSGSCVLKAVASQSGEEITKDLTYQWEKMGKSGWEILENKTAQTITVAAADIDTYGEYRVTVYLAGVEIGKDIQGVMDSSDPFDIDPHPVPEDETIDEDASGNGQVVYTPVVVKRGTGTKAIDTQFYFVIKDAAGVILNTDSTTAKSSCTVKREHCVQAGGDVSITMTAKD